MNINTAFNLLCENSISEIEGQIDLYSLFHNIFTDKINLIKHNPSDNIIKFIKRCPFRETYFTVHNIENTFGIKIYFNDMNNFEELIIDKEDIIHLFRFISKVENYS